MGEGGGTCRTAAGSPACIAATHASGYLRVTAVKSPSACSMQAGLSIWTPRTLSSSCSPLLPTISAFTSSLPAICRSMPHAAEAHWAWPRLSCSTYRARRLIFSRLNCRCRSFKGVLKWADWTGVECLIQEQASQCVWEILRALVCLQTDRVRFRYTATNF